MMNEALFLLVGFLALGTVAVSAIFGRMWLYVATVVMLLSTLVIVGKLAIIAGFTVAVGTASFAGIFLATDILSEFYGKKAAQRAIWLALFANVVFVALGYASTLFVGGINPVMDDALSTIFNFLPRVAAGSIIAFTVAQNLDVLIFHVIKDKTDGQHLWFRNTVSTSISQLVDSVIFIWIAFGGTVDNIWDIIISLWLVKVCVAVLDTPFIYAVRYVLEKYPKLRDWDKRMLDLE